MRRITWRLILITGIFVGAAGGAYADGINTDNPNLALPIGAGGNLAMQILPNGNVGIGYALTSPPTSTLDVSGVNDPSGTVVSFNHKAAFRIPGNSTNTTLGFNAMTASPNQFTQADPTNDSAMAPDSYNTAIGGYAAYSLTTANEVTALGYEAGYGITTGSANTALGKRALTGNCGAPLTGQWNVAAGDHALACLQGTASKNTAAGSGALGALTSGENETALGVVAGENDQGNENTFIGAYTAADANSYTNSTAVGYQATITGSNMIVLGNASVQQIVTAGTIQSGLFSAAPAVCTADNEGTQAYSANAHSFCFCNGSAWVQIAAPGSACVW